MNAKIENAKKWISNNSANLGTATIFVSLAVVGTVAWNTAPGPAPEHKAPAHVSAPVDHTTQANLCQEEDGSDQEFCWWYDQGTGWIMNIHHGEWSYVQSTGDMIHYAHQR